ncbi:hypothetical protein AQUCO_00400567v1 [Aquilegia coerulea]|uniref:Zinc finger PHD-type domain-containing protein n=1 Tax=Aquilegia coerulea TaxID=218851 RepID=A0A2G5EVL6_AQUCA|nr:hypothetical protein AQUCO_00400567v1 [Aquilegia coerulea]
MGVMTNYEAYKKRKRTPRLYGFQTFCDPGCPIFLTGPFRENIRLFLRECGEIEGFNVGGMPIWSILLVHENNGAVVPLYIIEETVDKHSSSPFCDHCRCTGWSHHFVSKRRYHFIIPVDEEWNKPLNARAFDLHTHLLHGLVHCNGFGHLLCINGIEGGSSCLCGREIMDLWDRICTSLRTRQISVEDTSRKRSMDLRLLYGIAYGYSWYGRWGYKFSIGSFGVTLQNYEAAVGILSSLNMDEVVKNFGNVRRSGKHIKQIIEVYRQVSDTDLITIRDLVRFMLSLKTEDHVQIKTILESIVPPKPSAKVTKKRKSPFKDGPEKYKQFSTFATEMESRWPARRLLYAAEVIVDALKEKKRGMSRQEVRDAARLCIGDTGLLDFVIKSINNHIVGDYLVQRTVHHSTKVLEFTVQQISGDTLTEQDEEETTSTFSPDATSNSPDVDVYCDLEYLYEHILEQYPKSGLLELAIQVLLDSKHFVKEWPFTDEDEQLRFICQVLPTPEELETTFTRPLAPGELLVLPPYATIGELKLGAENAFRDTYCIMEQFVAREVAGMNNIDDDEVVFGNMESGEQIWVCGSGMDLENELKYEGGAENWTVDCTCGAKDDDGERMVACDLCEVWQHTRCIGIEEKESAPHCSYVLSLFFPTKSEVLNCCF